jgi:thiol-disulfide isomerase/thioredoxin
VPVPLLIVITVGALAIAVLAAVWLVGPGVGEDEVVAVEDLVSGEGRTAVEGTAVEGQPAPDTTFQLFDGGTATLDDLRGRPVLLNFWASTCAPCLEEMPAFERVHDALGDEITVVGIDVAEGVEPGREMLERTGVTYRQGRDPQGTMIRAYGGIQLPHTVLLDADGTVVALRNKVLDEDEIRALAEPLLGS